MADLCTLPMAKEYANLEGDTEHDALMARFVGVASDIIRGYTGQPFAAPVVETRYYDWNPKGFYSTGPLQNVTLVTIGGVSLAPELYYVNSRGGYVRITAYYYPAVNFGAVGITATFGEYNYAATADVPQGLQHAAAVIAARLWRMREQGFQAMGGNADMGTVAYERYLTPEDKMVLDKYKLSAAGFA